MQLAACHNTRGCLPKVLVVPEAGDSDEVDSRSASAPLRADSTGLITAGAAAEVVWHCSYSFEKVKRALSNTGGRIHAIGDQGMSLQYVATAHQQLVHTFEPF